MVFSAKHKLLAGGGMKHVFFINFTYIQNRKMNLNPSGRFSILDTGTGFQFWTLVADFRVWALVADFQFSTLETHLDTSVRYPILDPNGRFSTLDPRGRSSILDTRGRVSISGSWSENKKSKVGHWCPKS